MKILLFILLGISILLLLVLIIYLIVGYIVFRKYFKLSLKINKELDKKNKNHFESSISTKEYFNKHYQTIFIESNDNNKMFGYYKKCNNNKLVIILHDFLQNHYDMFDYVNIFENQDYDILVLDLRAHGKSEGDFSSMGYYEKDDLILWIKEMLNINKDYKIILYGVSLGASIVCLALGENLPNNVVLAIEDSGFDNAEKELSFINSKKKIKLFLNLLKVYMRKTKKINLRTIDVCKSLNKCKIPVLFIHGEKDDIVPCEMVYTMFKCLPQNRKSLYVVKESIHNNCLKENPYKYKKVIYKFLNDYNM